MNIIRLPVAPVRHHSIIDAAIAVHGPLPVLRAAIRALIPRRRIEPRQTDLSDHLRRDLGLHPLPYAPPAIDRPPFA